jgi:tRNA pseudouridine38-40 synthase
MPRYLFCIQYNGSSFKGWAKQPRQVFGDNEQETLFLPTVQQSLETAFLTLTGEVVRFFCSGRTDAGVHAYGQCAHIDTVKNYTLSQLMQGLNFHLKNTMVIIRSVKEVPLDFHARFSTEKRIYHYHLWNAPTPSVLMGHCTWSIKKKLDLSLLKEAAFFFQGFHNFSNFCAPDGQSLIFERTIDSVDLLMDHLYEEMIVLRFVAPSFLKQQVRRIVGSIVTATHLKKPQLCGQWLLNKIPPGQLQYSTAPAHGLCLWQVIY